MEKLQLRKLNHTTRSWKSHNSNLDLPIKPLFFSCCYTVPPEIDLIRDYCFLLAINGLYRIQAGVWVSLAPTWTNVCLTKASSHSLCCMFHGVPASQNVGELGEKRADEHLSKLHSLSCSCFKGSSHHAQTGVPLGSGIQYFKRDSNNDQQVGNWAWWRTAEIGWERGC